MSPVEYFWGATVLTFAVVGVIRTYARELGVTTMCVAALLLLLEFGEPILRFLQDEFGAGFPWLISARFAAGFHIGVFLVIVFISYQGIALSFKGSHPTGVLSAFLGLTVGLVNGYLIAGTVWYYLNHYDYPFGAVVESGLSSAASGILEILPPALFGDHPAYLLGLLILMLILSVWH